MKDMQHYRDVSERVVPRASCREEILNKAERMQPKKRRPVMRRIGIGLAAASLALAGTTVAFGAANNWDYQQVFTKYFSEKNDEPVSYDFSKIGMNINESREFPEGTLTVESALVTPYAMYLSWRFLPNETVTVSDTDLLWGSAFAIGTDCVLHSSTADSYQSMDSAVLDEDGAYHFTRNLFSIDGTFTDNTLYLSVNVTQFHEDCSRGFVVDTGENPFVLKTGTAHEPEFRKVDVSVHLTECKAKPCDANYISVSPLAVVLADEGGTRERVPGDSGGGSKMKEPCELTAVYADGTELHPETVNIHYLFYTLNPENPDDIKGQRVYLFFKTPLDTENLTAVRINGTEFSLK
ncbi:MAG: hypothetical protein IKI58_03275 [Oscillospiraceae bacterium]|nr:hypothetical protein [Oscillospiraceae bacterium]